MKKLIQSVYDLKFKLVASQDSKGALEKERDQLIAENEKLKFSHNLLMTLNIRSLGDLSITNG